MYKQSILVGIATIFVTISVINYMHFQAPAQSTAVMALEQQTSSSSSNQTDIVVARTPEEKANLERFDQLDFESWNTRNWTLFQEIHGPDVLVVDFSGNTTRGIGQHLDWATAFTSAEPESKVLAHPIKIAAGNWTAVTGTLPGNHTMITLAHWEDGRIAEEYLFSN
jgi:Flp pilus assembly protein CpaB